MQIDIASEQRRSSILFLFFVVFVINNNNNNAPGRTHTHTVARRALRHLGGHCDATPSLLHIWAEARRALAQQQKQRPRVKRRITLTFPRGTFFRLAFGTFGPTNQACCDFLSSLRHLLVLVSDDPWVTSFRFQRLSVAIQCFNLVCICHSFGSLLFFDQPRHT